jgi:hypothetical protein
MKSLVFNEERRYSKAYLPLNNKEFGECTHLKIRVEYTQGGQNFLSGTPTPRCYRVSLIPVSRGSNGCESFTLLGDRRISGGYVIIEPTNKYNKKHLLELSEMFDSKLNDIFDAFVNDDTVKLREIITIGYADKTKAVVSLKPEIASKQKKLKLLNKSLLTAFEKQGDCSEKKPEDVKVICKFFTPTASASWYMTEYNPKDKTFFGFANLGDSQMAELGYIALNELETFTGALGLGVERDRHFGNHTLKEVMDVVRSGGHI